MLGVKSGSLRFGWSYLTASALLPSYCAGQLCSSPRASVEGHVGSTEFVLTQCDLELEKELHSNFLLALILRKAKASLQQNCRRCLCYNRKAASFQTLQPAHMCRKPPSKWQRCFIHTPSSHEEAIFLASSWRTPNTLLCLLFRVVGVPVAWE